MKRSVSRVIDRSGNGLYTRLVGNQIDSIGYHEVEMAFGKIPKGRYRVTYTLSTKGKYLMCKEDGSCPGLDHPGNHAGGLAVCFLPREWAEMRVNRKVENLPERRKK